MAYKESPIFSKTYDFTLWLLNHTEKFPKSERFRLARRLEDSTLDFYELLLQATHNANKVEVLRQADLELNKIRIYLRLCHARKLTGQNQYQYASQNLVELGKLLGGWIKTAEG